MILHVLTGTCHNDSRVVRAADAATELDDEVLVLARHVSGLPRSETTRRGVRIDRIPLCTNVLASWKPLQLAKYGELVTRMAHRGVRCRPQVVHAHDLSALPIAARIARATGAAIVYDSHELWSDIVLRSPWPQAVVRAALSMERRYARRAAAVITVSDGIADEMTRRLGIPRPLVIRNIPDTPSWDGSDSPLRNAAGLAPEVQIVLYQGHLSPGRGLDTLLDAFAILRSSTAHLVVLGSGPSASALAERVRSEPALARRVILLPAVPARELANWTRGATLGVHPIEGDVVNHLLCLPNKLFEYIHAGLPVVVSDMPEMARLVDRFEIGRTFARGNAWDLAAKLDAMLSDCDGLAAYGEAVVRSRSVLTWDSERQHLLDLYSRLKPAIPGSDVRD
jgi:glycosyltransferase involved in cell wall biosynthesis